MLLEILFGWEQACFLDCLHACITSWHGPHITLRSGLFWLTVDEIIILHLSNMDDLIDD
jgi:hypothetical protein